MAVLRFATLNLLHGLDPDTAKVREPDLRAAAALLDGDIVGLQEVDRGQPRSNHVDQAEVFAAETGAQWWRFAATLTGAAGGGPRAGSGRTDGPAPRSGSTGPREVARRTSEERITGARAHPRVDAVVAPHPRDPAYGIALVSRLPVLEWHELRFPQSRWSLPLYDAAQRRLMPVPDEPRVALAAVVVGPDGPFTAATTHLSFVPGRNIVQLRRILRWLSTLPGPRYLFGDLNLPGPLPAVVSRWDHLARIPTYPSWRPRVQWDHVLADELGPAQVVATEALRLPVSDHRGLRVDVFW